MSIDIWSKSDTQYTIGNDRVLSVVSMAYESCEQRVRIYCLDNLSKDKIINLVYNLAVLHCTITDDSLTSYVLNSYIVGCIYSFGGLSAGNLNQRNYELQGPKLRSEIARNMGYSKMRKRQEYRSYHSRDNAN